MLSTTGTTEAECTVAQSGKVVPWLWSVDVPMSLPRLVRPEYQLNFHRLPDQCFMHDGISKERPMRERIPSTPTSLSFCDTMRPICPQTLLPTLLRWNKLFLLPDQPTCGRSLCGIHGNIGLRTRGQRPLNAMPRLICKSHPRWKTKPARGVSHQVLCL